MTCSRIPNPSLGTAGLCHFASFQAREPRMNRGEPTGTKRADKKGRHGVSRGDQTVALQARERSRWLRPAVYLRGFVAPGALAVKTAKRGGRESASGDPRRDGGRDMRQRRSKHEKVWKEVPLKASDFEKGTVI